LNENREFAKMRSIISKQNNVIAEAKKVVRQKAVLVERKEREIRIIKESTQRKDTMSELLGALNKEKAGVMRDLLENVQTNKIRAAYDKYLPAVLNNSPISNPAAKPMIVEGRKEMTGDKSAKTSLDVSDNVFDIKRLAGLK